MKYISINILIHLNLMKLTPTNKVKYNFKEMFLLLIHANLIKVISKNIFY